MFTACISINRFSFQSVLYPDKKQRNYCWSLKKKIPPLHPQAEGTGASSLFFRSSSSSHVSLFLLREGKPALPTLQFSCLKAQRLLRIGGTKGPAHFYSAHMPASAGGGQQQENRGGEVKGKQISNSKPGLLDFFFSPPSILTRCFFSCKVSGYKSDDSACENGKFCRPVLHGRSEQWNMSQKPWLRVWATSQQVTQSASVLHKFQGLGLRAFTFLHSSKWMSFLTFSFLEHLTWLLFSITLFVTV